MDFASNHPIRPAKQVERIFAHENRVENYCLPGLLAVTGMRVGEVPISGREI
jgi:integrase